MGKNTQNYTENDTINKKAKIIYTHNIDNFNVLNSTAKINRSKLSSILYSYIFYRQSFIILKPNFKMSLIVSIDVLRSYSFSSSLSSS